MKIINLHTNAETITIGSADAVLPPGFTVDLGNVAAVIRGNTYGDDGTNVFTIAIQPSAVMVTSVTDPLHEFGTGWQAGILIAPIMVLVLLIKRHFARGDAFD